MINRFDNDLVKEINRRVDRHKFSETFELPPGVLKDNKQQDLLYIALACNKKELESYEYYSHYHVSLDCY